jgi:hypothetical protein
MMRWLILLTLIVVLAACAAHQIAQSHQQRVFMVDEDVYDNDKVCIRPLGGKGSLFSQCLTGARFRGEANSIKAN